MHRRAAAAGHRQRGDGKLPTGSAPTTRAATCSRRSSTACASACSSASSSAAIALAIGIAVGLVAAYAGGRIDALLMRIVDLQLSFPAILVALVLLAVLGQGVDKVHDRAGHRCSGPISPAPCAARRWSSAARNTSRRRAASALPPARIVLPPHAAQLPAAADRGRHRRRSPTPSRSRRRCPSSASACRSPSPRSAC